MQRFGPRRGEGLASVQRNSALLRQNVMPEIASRDGTALNCSFKFLPVIEANLPCRSSEEVDRGAVAKLCGPRRQHKLFVGEACSEANIRGLLDQICFPNQYLQCPSNTSPVHLLSLATFKASYQRATIVQRRAETDYAYLWRRFVVIISLTTFARTHVIAKGCRSCKRDENEILAEVVPL